MKVAIYAVIVSSIVSLLVSGIGFLFSSEDVEGSSIAGLQVAMYLFQALMFFIPCFISSFIVGLIIKKK